MDAEGKKEQVEGVTVVPPLAEIAEPGGKTEIPPQTKTNTQDEVSVLREQIKQIQANHEKAYKGLQRTLNEKDRKLKELETNFTPNLNQVSNLKAAIDVLADESNLEPTRLQKLIQLRAQLAEEERKAHWDAQVHKQQQKSNEEWEKLRQKITDAGLDPEDDALEDVVYAFEVARDATGNFETAHKRLDRVLNKVKKAEESKKTEESKKVEEKKPETEAQIRERIEREVLEKHGLLDKEKVAPTGSSRGLTYEAIKKMSPEELVANSKEIAKLPLTL